MAAPINPAARTAAEVLAARGHQHVAALYGRGWTEGEVWARVAGWYPLLSDADLRTVLAEGAEFRERTHAAEPQSHPFPSDVRGIRYTPGLRQRTVTVTGLVTVINARGYQSREGTFRCVLQTPIDWSEVDLCAQAMGEQLMAVPDSPPPSHYYWEVVDIERGFFIEYR